MINRPHTTLYWQWLCNIIGLDSIQTHSYLLGFLFSELFCAFCEDDYSRMQDAIDLRETFCLGEDDYSRMQEDIDSRKNFRLNNPRERLYFPVFSANMGPANVLEVLVAFCIRIENDIACDPRNEPNPGKWFWIMMENLGLTQYDDNRFDEDIVREIVDQFLERHFMPDGRGGLFIFKNPSVDARELSLWEQLCAYINENPHLIS